MKRDNSSNQNRDSGQRRTPGSSPLYHISPLQLPKRTPGFSTLLSFWAAYELAPRGGWMLVLSITVWVFTFLRWLYWLIWLGTSEEVAVTVDHPADGGNPVSPSGRSEKMARDMNKARRDLAGNTEK